MTDATYADSVNGFKTTEETHKDGICPKTQKPFNVKSVNERSSDYRDDRASERNVDSSATYWYCKDCGKLLKTERCLYVWSSSDFDSDSDFDNW